MRQEDSSLLLGMAERRFEGETSERIGVEEPVDVVNLTVLGHAMGATSRSRCPGQRDSRSVATPRLSSVWAGSPSA
jgi:hypothetical protein